MYALDYPLIFVLGNISPQINNLLAYLRHCRCEQSDELLHKTMKYTILVKKMTFELTILFLNIYQMPDFTLNTVSFNLFSKLKEWRYSNPYMFAIGQLKLVQKTKLQIFWNKIYFRILILQVFRCTLAIMIDVNHTNMIHTYHTYEETAHNNIFINQSA